MLRAVRSFTENTALRIIGQTALALGLILILVLLRTPTLKGTIWNNPKPVTNQYRALPIRGGTSQNVSVGLRIGLLPMQSTLFRLKTETCLTDVTVNGRFIGRICPKQRESDMDFGPFLSVGENILQFTLTPYVSQAAFLDLYPSPRDPLLTLLFFMAAIIAGVSVVALFRRWTGSGNLLTGIFGFGILLRFLYASATPPWVRSYDYSGHAEYIRFLLTHHTMPMLGQGWEAHQPPLYYTIAAAMTKVTHLVSWSESQDIVAIQYLSLILSVCTLAVGLWTSQRLFRGLLQQRACLTFAAIVAVFPGLVMMSSRISNDALYQLTAFAFIACLIVWWEKGTMRSLVAAAVTLSLGMLTKENTLLMVAAFLACILIRPGTSWRTKIGWLAIGAGILAVMAGWLSVIRITHEGLVKHFAFEAYALSGGLRINRSFSSLFVFSPSWVFADPYVSTWFDATGRQFFWIFFFKSALFGEFSYAPALLPLSRVLVTLGMAMAPILAFGAAEGIFRRERFLAPLLLTAFFCVLGVIAYRMSQPYSCNQDFRFALPVIIPLAYLTALAVRTPFDITRDVFLIWTTTFILFAAAFITGIIFFP